MTSPVEELSKRLIAEDTQEATLHKLLQLSSRGHDITDCVDRVIDNCLRTPTPQILSLSLDVILLCSSHERWIDVLKILIDNLALRTTTSCLVILLKIPNLPHVVLQHMLLYSTTALTDCLSLKSSPSPSIRRAAVHAVSAIVLRTRPLTTIVPSDDDDAVHLEIIRSPQHITALRRAVERLLFALLETVFDSSDSVAIPAFKNLTQFAHSTVIALPPHAPLAATARATARTITQILVASLPRLADRFAPVFARARIKPSSTSAVSSGKNASNKETRQQPLNEVRQLRSAITSFGLMAAHVLSKKHEVDNSTSLPPSHNNNNTTNLQALQTVQQEADTPETGLRDAQRRATTWIETALLPISDTVTGAEIEISANASLCLLTICSQCEASIVTSEKIYAWGCRAVRNLLRVLSQDEKPIPSVVASGWVRDIIYALAALSKSEHVTAKFISSSATAILPFAATCPGRPRRLQALTLLAFTVVEYDLSGGNANDSNMNGNITKAVTKCAAWRSIMAEMDASVMNAALTSEQDTSSQTQNEHAAAELVCCFGVAMLESARKISLAPEAGGMRLQLTHTWALMLSHILRACVGCLYWTHSLSPSSSYAKEIFLKLFAAAGQYSSFLMRAQGIGMEEYERMQELLVKASLDSASTTPSSPTAGSSSAAVPQQDTNQSHHQQDIVIQAALLVCITKYWLSSGMKAEANAGHIMKAIWKHVQEHYRDADILAHELRTGALWSEAKQGLNTRAERAVEGGYASVATRVSKRTRAVLDTVGTSVSTAIEARLFGSIALATAADEGSTLTTDYVYSGLNALIGLVSHNPPLAEKALKLLDRYLILLQQAESSDFIAIEAVRHAQVVLQAYENVEHVPKPVNIRNDATANANQNNEATVPPASGGGLDWLQAVSDNCIFATSRLSDSARELAIVASEEAVLHACALAKRKLAPFRADTMQPAREDDGSGAGPGGAAVSDEGDSQTLHGSSDPFSVVVSHAMNAVKGIALLHVRITNRTQFPADIVLHYSVCGALQPLPDSPTSFTLGAINSGMTISQRIPVFVRRQHGFEGRVFMRLIDKARSTSRQPHEQALLSYYIPSADVLVLKKPATNAHIDVFRRRWDAMRHDCTLRVLLAKGQSLDTMVDLLERRSQCLKAVGRMRTFSHVALMTADSASSEYITLAALAPEARAYEGIGPCVVYLMIRANSYVYALAFRDECRDWLANGSFKVHVPDERPGEDRAVMVDSVQLQDAYFIREPDTRMSHYQRWRQANAIRASL